MRPGAVSPDSAARFDPVIGAQVEVLLKKERMLHERLKREILEGKYVPRELVDGALGGFASLVIQILDELELSLPPRLAGKTSGQIEADLIAVLDAARQRLADKAEIELVRVVDVNSAERHRGRGRPAAGIQS
jgi:hypothetical protein